MSKRSISEIIKDSISARNQELDRLYNNTQKHKVTGKIKSTIPTGPEHREANTNTASTKMQFTKKHEGKWAVLTNKKLGGSDEWHVHSIHNTINDTEPHLDNGVDFNVPMYIDSNLHKVNIVGHEKFL